jgi:hypothetical protein
LFSHLNEPRIDCENHGQIADRHFGVSRYIAVRAVLSCRVEILEECRISVRRIISCQKDNGERGRFRRDGSVVGASLILDQLIKASREIVSQFLKDIRGLGDRWRRVIGSQQGTGEYDDPFWTAEAPEKMEISPATRKDVGI